MMRTTRDAILHGMLMIEQPEEGPRVSVDSVLLASFVKARRKEKIIELGSAHGAVSLLLAKRFPHVTVEGLEIQAELAALAEPESLALRDGLERAGLEQERRALRVRPGGFTWQWEAADVLVLSFSLPPGSYATAVLQQLGGIVDAAAGAA